MNTAGRRAATRSYRRAAPSVTHWSGGTARTWAHCVAPTRRGPGLLRPPRLHRTHRSHPNHLETLAPQPPRLAQHAHYRWRSFLPRGSLGARITVLVTYEAPAHRQTISKLEPLDPPVNPARIARRRWQCYNDATDSPALQASIHSVQTCGNRGGSPESHCLQWH